VVAVEAEAETDAGAPGTVAGVTAADAADAADEPTALLATTLYVYAVPFVSGETKQETAGAVAVQVPATVVPSGAYAVTVYEVIGEPPFPTALFAGAIKETVACPFSTVATGEVGALGTDAGVIGPAVEAADVPVELVAVTENV
jgi:hypothetical protein